MALGPVVSWLAFCPRGLGSTLIPKGDLGERLRGDGLGGKLASKI